MHVTASRTPLGRAHLLASAIVRDAERTGLPAESLTPLGSLRRFAPDVGDVSLLAIAAPGDRAAVVDGFARLAVVSKVQHRSERSIGVLTERGPVTLHLATRDQGGAALVWHTGSRAHTAALQARARARGLVFDDAGLTRAGVPLVVSDETELYRVLELPYIPPELREGLDEVDVAGAGGLPSLVTATDIRGDLHMHSTWSDGRDSIAAMVRTAQSLGYEYVAITDHSERSTASRALRASDVARQREEIDGVRARVPGIDVLHGIEVDIMKDGSLDFDDRTLEAFDIVLASLHDHGNQPPERLTNRYLRAIAHPLVNVITHPAGRSPGYFGGYALDFDRLFEAAAETGTAMEIDGAPGHLDMDGAVARRAAAAGVTVVVDSDCHRADALGRQMVFGIGTARRGWIEPRHVLNTRRLADVRGFVAHKRARVRAGG